MDDEHIRHLITGALSCQIYEVMISLVIDWLQYRYIFTVVDMTLDPNRMVPTAMSNVFIVFDNSFVKLGWSKWGYYY